MCIITMERGVSLSTCTYVLLSARISWVEFSFYTECILTMISANIDHERLMQMNGKEFKAKVAYNCIEARVLCSLYSYTAVRH